MSHNESRKFVKQVNNEIEHILIEIYNFHISVTNSQNKTLNISDFQKQVNIYC